MNPLGQAYRTNGVLLAVLNEKLSAGVSIVLLDRLNNVADRQPITQQGVGSDIDLILLFETAKRQNLGHATDGL